MRKKKARVMWKSEREVMIVAPEMTAMLVDSEFEEKEEGEVYLNWRETRLGRSCRLHFLCFK